MIEVPSVRGDARLEDEAVIEVVAQAIEARWPGQLKYGTRLPQGRSARQAAGA
jgi:hypothetical protein